MRRLIFAAVIAATGGNALAADVEFRSLLGSPVTMAALILATFRSRN